MGKKYGEAKMEEVEELDWTRCLKHASKQPCLLQFFPLGLHRMLANN
jgi:hypothetical protein